MLRALWITALVTASLPGLACFSKRANQNPWKAPDLSRFAPAPWTSNRVFDGQIRVARIRVYGDHELRAQSPSWNRQFNEWIDQANQVMVPELGVRLEVVEFQPWTRQTASNDLSAILEELEQRDSGADVEWVVGVITALSSVTPDVHELGMARPLGRHLIIRGHSDLAERKALAKFTGVKEDFFQARKRHKQAGLLLHELGHTLGAVHVRESESALMYPSYSNLMAGFVKDNARLMGAVLEERLRRPDPPSFARERDALAKAVGDEPWPGWIEPEYQELRTWLAEVAKNAEGEGAGAGKAHGPSQPRVPPEAHMNYSRVQGLAQKGELDAAWAEHENLIQSYPKNVEFRVFACRFWLRREGPKQRASEHCRRVGELDPDDPSGELALAAAHVQAEQPAEAHAVLERVLERIPAMTANQQATFDAVIALYGAMSAVTFTERAVAAAPAELDTQAARAWALSTRRRYGLPPDGTRHGITPEREGEYIAMVRQVLDLTYGKRYSEARKLARKGSREFRDGPGFSGALCDLEYRARAYAAARKHCATALRYYGEASWPRYLMGILELRAKHNRVGIKHLEQAIDSDPELRQAYHALYQAYARIKDKAAQSTLRAAYYERFGVPLPTR